MQHILCILQELWQTNVFDKQVVSCQQWLSILICFYCVFVLVTVFELSTVKQLILELQCLLTLVNIVSCEDIDLIASRPVLFVSCLCSITITRKNVKGR